MLVVACSACMALQGRCTQCCTRSPQCLPQRQHTLIRHSTAAALTVQGLLQDIAGMVYAFGALRYHPGPVLEAAVAEVQRRPDQFLSKDWAALLQGMTRLLCDPGPLFGVLREQV